ncbi:subtilisin-like protease [Colletotrichum karsti]|uniref:Subtilisin-like protease n=1 Tax=Colletotrichum karsti TaxID=1095194 RepID=A0A9P6LP04_9PEZI|nr:subtilisin-like protease [Colletotrichum karsti]KAF9880260.1 subtilisin-like protease [Colletotrichum karsti]
MAKGSWILFLSSLLAGVGSAADLKKTYIVQLRQAHGGDNLLRRSLVDASVESVSGQAADVLYTYENTVNGYAAKFTDEQADALKSQPDVLSVRLDKVYHLHTSRSPQFLGLMGNDELLGRSPMSPQSSGLHAHRRADDTGVAAESDLIIGIFDTGAWPENPGYRDDGVGPIPSRWKGACEEGDGWTASNCNNKLIGARAFYKGYVAAVTNGSQPFNWTGEYQSPRDDDGHGTHTSTTAGGSAVQGASLFGQASGTARGMAEHARLAMYKVCWKEGCFDSDILAAMDKAIEDGVNVMSLSLGPDQPTFNEDEGIVVGSFAAMEKGIFVAVSAGNSGPGPGTVTNLSPWTLNVAASTIDRDFPAHVTLGNGKNYTGASLYSNGSVTDIEPLAEGQVLPLIHGSLAGKGNSSTASFCLDGSLDAEKVAGKIVLCVRGQSGRAEKGGVVKAAGGRGMIVVNPEANGEELIADAHVLPALHLGFKDGAEVAAYAKTYGATVVFDFEGTRVGVPAPYMAAFSSRGPNIPIPGLAKPDITGPGVSILAGWAGQGPAGIAADTRKVDYNVISGTSMSCPHLSGIAAYIMARRPEWSPAAVRSAMMTTAYVTLQDSTSPIVDSSNLESASPLSYGNGHVDPIAALDPGLVYDLTTNDYLDFLCAVNTSTTFISGITRSNFTCNSYETKSVYDFNYPSFSALYESPAGNGTYATNGSYTATFTRTVTNVGEPGTYKADVFLNDPSLVKIAVKPDTLTFSSVGEKQSYVVTATLSSPRSGDASSWGRLVWSDGKHDVGSSLTFLWSLPSEE